MNVNTEMNRKPNMNMNMNMSMITNVIMITHENVYIRDRIAQILGYSDIAID
jgi:hypothetical protein